jgi:putative Mg2+ transporter-C (MgtC) family protein
VPQFILFVERRYCRITTGTRGQFRVHGAEAIGEPSRGERNIQEQIAILGKVAFAAVLGGIIGTEREYVRKAAGLRTHMLVAGAACLLQSLAPIMATRIAGSASAEALRMDPTRIIQAIITGISFLGAGTIIFHREAGVVEGLTTAATILLVAAVGVTVAVGELVVAAGVTAGTIIVLVAVKSLEDAIRRARRRNPAGWRSALTSRQERPGPSCP